MFRLAVIVVLFGLLSYSHEASIPKTWKVCKLSNPQFNECLKKAATGAISDLMPGNSGLGVKPLDPLVIKSLIVSKGTGPVSLNLAFSDLQLKNLKYFEIVSLENNWKTLKAKLRLPKGLRIVGKYKTDGQILSLPIKGEGDADLQLENMTVDASVFFVEKKVRGTAHYQVDKIEFDFETSRLEVKMSGLFGRDKALGENMNKFLNANWKALLDELKKPFNDALSKEIKAIANQVFSKISKNEISPP